MKFPRHEFKKGWEWAAMLRDKKIRADELSSQFMARVKADKTNSFLTVMEKEAKEMAALADKNGYTKAISGIPLGVKDNLITFGTRTTCGSKILGNYIPPYDATVVKKLRDAGSVFMGKCNMDEFAMGSSNENSAYGPVSLPQDPKRVPGGSSGGSAAAVAGNLSVYALGSDTGGSVRQPASFCGVVGMKPTYGRISRYGLVAYASSLDQIGPLALDAQDCADLLEEISGYDQWDATSLERAVPKYGHAVERIRLDKDHRADFLKNLRVGIPAEYFAEGLSADVRIAVEKGIKAMKDAGAKIVPVSLPHSKHSLPVYYVVAVAEASANLSRYDGVRFGPRILPHGAQTTLD